MFRPAPVFLALLVLVAGLAQAQQLPGAPVPGSPTYVTYGRHAIGDLIRNGKTFTAEEIYSTIKGTKATKAMSFGRVIGYTGAITLAAEGTNYLLSKALEELKKEATGNSDFDEWTHIEPLITNKEFFWDEYNNQVDFRTNDITKFSDCRRHASVRPSGYFGPDGEGGYYAKTTNFDGVVTRSFFPTLYSLNDYKDDWKSATQSTYLSVLKSCDVPRPDFQDWVDGNPQKNISPHPDAIDVLPEVIGDQFKREQDRTLRYPTPGVELAPAPNPNQWTDEPCTSPNADTDGDGFSDCEEASIDPKTGKPYGNPRSPYVTPETVRIENEKNECESSGGTWQANNTCKKLDTDKDGIPDDEDTDDDNDGVPDDKDPEPKNANIPVKCGTGFKASADGKTCEPEKEADKCPEGYKPVEGANPPKCEPDESKDKDPVGDECGDFSLKRAAAHTAHWMRDILISCNDVDWVSLLDPIKEKFPFSLISGMNDLVDVSGASSAGSPIPSQIGPFKLDLSFATAFLAFIKLAWRAVLWYFVIRWLIDRLSGQVVLS